MFELILSIIEALAGYLAGRWRQDKRLVIKLPIASGILFLSATLLDSFFRHGTITVRDIAVGGTFSILVGLASLLFLILVVRVDRFLKLRDRS